MKKWTKLFFTALSALLLLNSLSLQSFAADKIDTAQEASLTICYVHEEQPLSDAEFNLYRVADVSADVQFTVDEAIASYPVDFENMDEDRWAVLANTLQGYVEKDALMPSASGKTDTAGRLVIQNLKPGLYLVLGTRVTVGISVYSAVPFLICIPSADNSTGEWNYDPVAYPKTTVNEVPPVPEKTTVKVLMIWNDKGSESKRPAQISVQLLCDGEPYSTVTLSKENHWSYIWNDLDKDHSWNVIEIAIENYKVEQTKDGITFCLTNTYTGTPPAKPDPPHNPLPQTGLLWWPVPALVGAGIMVVVIALVLRKRSVK
ncbi:MAG: hypothetical protein CW335_02820 [Clostridiales bacterium]|nr:hypothetical protein [Clostridiales bacterium]